MSISRRINGLQIEVWNGMRSAVVREGLMLKFGQNEELRRLLLDTGDRELVYAAASREWGVGFVVSLAFLLEVGAAVGRANGG